MVQTINENRVNSGNPKLREQYGNPEPSQQYTAGRCRDYRRGTGLLITGIERPTTLWVDDIVHSALKDAAGVLPVCYAGRWSASACQPSYPVQRGIELYTEPLCNFAGKKLRNFVDL